MKALPTSLMRSPPQLTNGRNQPTLSPTIGQSMLGRHICLCCSYTLFRHMRLEGIYWRCSHCHQEMPA
ncbi:MAG TPA: hypothetical protein DCY88_29150 [Cyanobacteria bacterium UBA11372]|nr:hypothetical protein [Cyanobacteria bacterium UBA11372]